MRDKLISKSSFVGKLVEYYDDFFFDDCRINDECEYIHKLLNAYGAKSVLDVGCGTGIHDVALADRGYDIKGIDISEDMVKFASNRAKISNIKYEQKDICKWHSKEKFDACISLSHVIGYQLQNEDIENMLCNINRSLKNGGIFVFNFYNLAGILINGLYARKKEVELGDRRILRFSNAKLNMEFNEINLDYYYFIDDYRIDAHYEIEIEEKMRCFTSKEICYYIEKNGFKILDVCNYMQNVSLQKDEWNGGIICKKCL